MAVFAEDSTRFSAVVKYEQEPQLGFCRESITLTAVADITLKVGAVLGVDADAKYKLAAGAATDGSQYPAAILIADGLGLSRDIALKAGDTVKALALVRGAAIVAGEALQLGAGIALADVKDTLVDSGILVETAV